MKEFLDSGAGVLALFIIYLIEKIIALLAKRKEAKRLALQRIQEEEKKQEKELKSSYEFTSEIDRMVRHIETGFLSPFRPMRVFVIHFHNGTYTDAGLSLPKMTISHEIKERYSVLPITDTHQEIPVPDFLKSAFNRVRMTGSYYLKDIQEIAEPGKADHNPDFAHWLTYYEVNSMYCTSLRDRRGKIVACLVLQFKGIHTLNKQDIIEINEQKKRIEHIYDRI